MPTTLRPDDRKRRTASASLPTRAGARRASWSTGRWPVSRRSRIAGRGPPTASRGTVPGCSLPLHECLTGERGAGVAMCFLREPWLRGHRRACRTEASSPSAGATSRSTSPRSARPRRRACRGSRSSCWRACPAPDAELRAYRARRRAERLDGVYVASLSFRTVTYKALCARRSFGASPRPRRPGLGGSVGDLPPALLDEHRAELGRAQPFRLLGHNGEINTIDGNVEWMESA